MNDPILTGSNPEADRRLLHDVLSAPDQFDGGCPADTIGTAAPASDALDEQIRNSRTEVKVAAFEVGFMRGVRAMSDALERDGQVQSPAFMSRVFIHALALMGKPREDAASRFRAEARN